jgi:antitoxin (DNA-binding transcriptional repressor) of toxin-antitoxin stability system
VGCRASEWTIGDDHGTISGMDTLPISRFKVTCLAAIERVRRTGRPLLVTRRGVPIAQVVPPPPPETDEDAFGALQGMAVELEDILAPLPENDWEALR